MVRFLSAQSMACSMLRYSNSFSSCCVVKFGIKPFMSSEWSGVAPLA